MGGLAVGAAREVMACPAKACAGHALALPAIPCRGDVFPAVQGGAEIGEDGPVLVFQALARLERWIGPNLLERLVNSLHNHRRELLVFAAALEQELTRLAQEFALPLATVRAVLEVQVLDDGDPRRWPREARWRHQLRGRFYGLAVAEVAQQTVRASSVVENLNGRLRSYFSLRRHLGPDYLTLLQFFLNHRRLARSAHAERVDHSLAELLTGQRQPHWLERHG
jgi:hypothetical protein